MNKGLKPTLSQVKEKVFLLKRNTDLMNKGLKLVEVKLAPLRRYREKKH